MDSVSSTIGQMELRDTEAFFQLAREWARGEITPPRRAAPRLQRRDADGAWRPAASTGFEWLEMVQVS